MYRIYNQNTKQFYAGHGYWSTRGKVWMRKSDMLCSFNYYKYDETFLKNIWVYEYADDGTRTVHYDIKMFIGARAKKDRKRVPFKVGFINGKMKSWISVYESRNSDVIYEDGLSTFDDLLVLEEMDRCASGTGAWFTGVNTNRKYYALPSAFMKMIPLLCAGTIIGTFGYVNRGQSTKGIELLEHSSTAVKPNDDSVIFKTENHLIHN